MTKKTHFTEAQECEGKHSLIARDARRIAARSKHPIEAYKCGYCRKWHVGKKLGKK